MNGDIMRAVIRLSQYKTNLHAAKVNKIIDGEFHDSQQIEALYEAVNDMLSSERVTDTLNKIVQADQKRQQQEAAEAAPPPEPEPEPAAEPKRRTRRTTKKKED
jgi:hypothetical protein